MRQTQCEVYIMINPEDGEFRYDIDAENYASWCSLSQMIGIIDKPFATFEPDFVRASGNYLWWDLKAFEYESVYQGVWSKEKSDASGMFKNPLKLSLTYPDRAYSNGFLIVFGNARPRKFLAAWYNGETKMREKVFTTSEIKNGDTIDFGSDQPLGGFTRMELTFLESEKPYSYIKFLRFLISLGVNFKADELIKVNAVKQTDLLANSLPIGTLTLDVINKDQRFNVLNEDNIYCLFTKGSDVYCDLHITENGETVKKSFGTYKLDTFESNGASSARFNCVDQIGYYDDVPFRFETFRNGTEVSTSEYFKEALNLPTLRFSMIVDPAIENSKLSGYNNAKTVREAFQKICVASTSTLKTSEGQMLIAFLPFASTEKGSVGKKYGEEKGKKRKKVDGVTVTYYTFTETPYISQKSVTLTGTYQFHDSIKMTFGEAGIPDDVLITGGKATVLSTTSSKPVKVEFDFSSLRPGEMDLSVKVDTQMPGTTATISVQFTGIKIEKHPMEVTVGEVSNNIIKDNTLITSEAQARKIAQHWYDYYNTYGMDIDYNAILEPDFAIGGISTLETDIGTQYDHFVTSIQADLTGGLTAKVKGVGRNVG